MRTIRLNTLQSMARVFVTLVAIGAYQRAAFAGAVLTHRYTFETNANDVVGSANGTLENGAIVTNGALVLDGVQSRMKFPGSMFTNYDSLSLEAWFVDQGGPATSPVLYSFNQDNAAVAAGVIYQTVDSSGNGRGFHDPSTLLIIPGPVVGITNHMVWTEDNNTHRARLYVNGLLRGERSMFSTPATIGPMSNCWLGYRGVPQTFFNGKILEFRSYSNALSALEVAYLDAAGPDQPVVNPGNLLGIRTVIRSNSAPGASLPVSVFADYDNLSNVNISSQPELALSVDNTNVAVATTNLKVQTIANGSAAVTATYFGFSNAINIAVGSPDDYSLRHRYSFSSVPPDFVAYDSLNGANGRMLLGQMTNGQMFLNGSTPFLNLPGGLISCLGEVSIEAWVTPTNPGSFARIFDFGSQHVDVGGMRGTSYLYLSPNGGQSVIAAPSTNDISGEKPRRLIRFGALPLGAESHVAVTYSPARSMMKLYINGGPVDSAAATILLSAINDTNCWLGRSQFTVDGYYQGAFNEFRIYDGFLTDADIAADYAAGPDVVGVDYSLFSSNSGPNLTLSWRPPMAGWILKSSQELGPSANWTEVGITPAFQNGRYSVTVQMTNAPLYFRLFKP